MKRTYVDKTQCGKSDHSHIKHIRSNLDEMAGVEDNRKAWKKLFKKVWDKEE